MDWIIKTWDIVIGLFALGIMTIAGIMIKEDQVRKILCYFDYHKWRRVPVQDSGELVEEPQFYICNHCKRMIRRHGGDKP